MFKKIQLLVAALAISSFAHAEVGVSEKTITIGQFAAFTGPSGALGTRVNAGINAYVESINAAGGVNGRRLHLVTRDDGYEPEKSKVAVTSLINDEKVFAMLGSVGTPTTLAALPILTEYKVPLIGPVTGASSLRTPFNKYLFHIRASYDEEAEQIVRYLAPIGLKRVALLYQKDSYGQAGLSAVTAAMKRSGMELVATAEVERNTVKVDEAVQKILKADPQAIIQVSTYKTVAAFIRKAKADGYRYQFYNLSFVGSNALATELGDSNDRTVVISQVVPFPFSTANPLTMQYQSIMKKYGDGQFDFSSMEGFLVAKVFVDGLSRAGRNLTREGFISAMESLKSISADLPAALSYSPVSRMGTNFVELTFLKPNGSFIR